MIKAKLDDELVIWQQCDQWSKRERIDSGRPGRTEQDKGLSLKP